MPSPRLAVITPVLSMLPGVCAAWEEDGTIEDVATIARAADRLGYDHLTCSEHVAVPEDEARVRGGRYFDPLATFGYLAAVTSRVRLATYVLVLGYHHPLAVAKRYGTLDVVSGGRLVLGVGVGSLRPEFELLGAPFADRGARADDALRALRAALSHPRPAYAGPYYRFDGLVVEPCASQAGVPLWVGGRTARSLRRAVELADGWVPFGLRLEEVAELLDAARRTEAWHGRRQPLEVVLQTGRPVDPLTDPAGAARAVARRAELGAGIVQLRFVHTSPAHFVEQLEAMAALVGAGSA